MTTTHTKKITTCFSCDRCSTKFEITRTDGDYSLNSLSSDIEKWEATVHTIQMPPQPGNPLGVGGVGGVELCAYCYHSFEQWLKHPEVRRD